MPNPWAILGAVAAVILAAISGYFYGKHVENLVWAAAVEAQKVEAARVLADHNDKMAALNLEVEHAHSEARAKLDEASGDIRRLAADLDRVRKSRRGTCSGDKVQPASGAAESRSFPDASGNPSGGFSELAEIADRAVKTAEYARVCREWVEGLPK